MPQADRYLIRKKNRYGRFVHVDTLQLPQPPANDFLMKRYGFGVFNIMKAQDGVQGLSSVGTFILSPLVRYRDWIPKGTNLGQTPSKIVTPENYSVGYYLVAEVSKVMPGIIHTPAQQEKASDDMEFLESAAAALQGYVVFEVIAGTPGTTKQCPQCRAFDHLESESCVACGYNYRVSEMPP